MPAQASPASSTITVLSVGQWSSKFPLCGLLWIVLTYLHCQMTVKGFDTLIAFLIFTNFLQFCFFHLTNMKMMFLDRSIWVSEEGRKGISQFD